MSQHRTTSTGHSSLSQFLLSLRRGRNQQENAGTRQRASASPDGTGDTGDSDRETPNSITGVKCTRTQIGFYLYQFRLSREFEQEFLKAVSKVFLLELDSVYDLPGFRVKRNAQDSSIYLVDGLIQGCNLSSLRYLSKVCRAFNGTVLRKRLNSQGRSLDSDIVGALAASGSYRCECLIDWLQGTFPEDKTQEFFDLIRQYFGELEDQGRKFMQYERQFKTPNGAIVALRHRDRDIQRGYFIASAGVFNQLSARRQRQLMIDFLKLGFICTRIDLTIDCFENSLTLFDVIECLESRCYTGFRDSVNYHFNGIGAGKGAGFTLGHRGSVGSGKYYLVYRKDLESKGARESLRFELSLYNYRSPSSDRGNAGAYAHQAFQVFGASDCSEWCALIRSYHAWAIDFVDRRPSKPGGRLKSAYRSDRFDWWDKLLDGAASAELSRCVVDRTLEKAEMWLHDQVAPTFAAVRQAIDQVGGNWEDFLSAFSASGDGRIKESHRYMIDQYVRRHHRQIDDRQKLDIISAFRFKLNHLLESSDEFDFDQLLDEYRHIENLALGLESQIPLDYWADCSRVIGTLAEFVDEFGVCRVPPSLDDLINWAYELRDRMRRIVSREISKFSWDAITRRFDQVSVLIDSDNPLLPSGLFNELCYLLGHVASLV